jgi:hypothetical protein
MPKKKPAARPKAKAEPVRVAFAGIIKNITTRIDVNGDKIGKIAIEFRPEGSIVADLDAIHKPDAEIFVVVAEKAE